MIPEELDAIEARANAATPEPWEAERWGEYVSGPNGIVADVVDGTDEERAANLAFLSAVRADVPTLVAEVRRLQTLIEELTRDPWETPPDNRNTSMLEILDRWTQIEMLVGNPTPQWVYDEIARRTEYGYQYEPAERLKIIDGVVRDIAMGRLP